MHNLPLDWQLPTWLLFLTSPIFHPLLFLCSFQFGSPWVDSIQTSSAKYASVFFFFFFPGCKMNQEAADAQNAHWKNGLPRCDDRLQGQPEDTFVLREKGKSWGKKQAENRRQEATRVQHLEASTNQLKDAKHTRSFGTAAVKQEIKISTAFSMDF